ncbi:MAG: XRE family transcriptional regulator [Clostridia bacterium]|nr:XRE family transcriptional regulator [Clostridia bacterium]
MKNLYAEMTRYGVTTSDIKTVLNCTDKTARSKMNGKSDLSIDDAFKIRDAFFPGMRLEYLFAPDEELERTDKRNSN